jgi:hypothetical protein
MEEMSTEQYQRIKREVILGMIACLEDLNVFLDLAEAYEIFPQEKIDKFRDALDPSKM